MKKLLSIVLALLMVVTMIPMAVLPARADEYLDHNIKVEVVDWVVYDAGQIIGEFNAVYHGDAFYDISFAQAADGTFTFSYTLALERNGGNTAWDENSISFKIDSCEEEFLQEFEKSFVSNYYIEYNIKVSRRAGHSFSDWTDVGDGTHTRICSFCGTAETKAHSFSGANCITKGKCVCGLESTKDSNNHSKRVKYVVNSENELKHDEVYECCGVINSNLDHKYDSDGMCTECKYQCEHTYSNSGICDACGLLKKNSDGYFEISNAYELLVFANMVNEESKAFNAKLVSDIDLEGAEWKTICETGLYYNSYGKDYGYSGIFDGNGHVIKNFKIVSSRNRDASVGLFGTVSGTVKNLGVENVRFVDGGRDIRAGAIVGQLITEDGLIENCYADNVIISPKDHITGGIAGCAYEAAIKNCYVVNSEFTGYSTRFGYIVGDTRADISSSDRMGTVINCYTDGERACGTQSGYIENCEIKTADRFANGEVAYLLGSAFGQKIGEDDKPVLNGEKVYFGYISCSENAVKVYSNNSNASDEKPVHDWSNLDGICANGCGAECDHKWSKGVLTRPSKTEEGYYTYTCSICKDTKTEPVERPANYAEFNELLEKVKGYRNKNLTDSMMQAVNDVINSFDLDENYRYIKGEEANVSQLAEQLNEFIEVVEEGIADGSAIKIDAHEMLNEYINETLFEFVDKYGEDEVVDLIDSLSDAFMDRVQVVDDEAKALTGSLKDNTEKLAELKEKVDEFLADIEKCLDGTHSFNYQITTPATCEKNAIESGECTVCGMADEREVPDSTLTHSFTKYETVEAAKCGVAGKEVASCDYGCGETDEKEIEALTHTDADGDYKCDNGCGHEFEKPEEPTDDVCEDCGKVHTNFFSEIICFFTRIFNFIKNLFA